MLNVNKLKGKIIENGLNVEELANKMDIDRATLYRRMRGDSDFTVREVSKIAVILNLSDDDLTSIFFAS